MDGCQHHALGCFSHVWLFETLWTKGSSILGILQAWILEWVAISFSRAKTIWPLQLEEWLLPQTQRLRPVQVLPYPAQHSSPQGRLEGGSPKPCFLYLYSPQNLKLFSKILSTHRQLMMRNLIFWVLWKRSVFIPTPKKGNAKECSNYRTIALISHTNEVMLKILQARIQQYVNHELPDVQACFRKGRGTRDQIANIRWVMEKARITEKHLFLLYLLCQSLWLCGSQ